MMTPGDGYRSRTGGAALDPRPPDDPPAGRPKRTWWILPYSAGLLSVLAVAALVTALPHWLAKAPKAPDQATSTAPAQPMPAEMFPDALFSGLTKDIKTGNEAGFLAEATPMARTAMQTWWRNLNALGFTTGAVVPTASHDTVRIDGHGDGSTVVLAGVHNALDPGYNGKPGVPLQRYRVGLHFASPTATGQITSWQPAGADPWDQPGGLYVRTGTNVVVAGLLSDKGLVDETLPLAQQAASYDLGLVNHVNPNDLLQEGFVVFVSGDETARSSWFAGDSQPKGWPLAWHGDRVFQLAGPGVSADDSAAPGDIADDSTGGVRVVLTPWEQDGETPQQEITGLEREFMIGIMAAHDQALFGGSAYSIPAWPLEGLGIATEALALANSNPAPATYDFGPLTTELHGLPASYRTGKLPDAQQLVGPHAQQWNDVAASVYEYIELNYGMNQMLASAALLWTRDPAPFGNVEDVAQSTSTTYAFFTQSTLETAWRTWLASL
jgi:hypothetical protein